MRNIGQARLALLAAAMALGAFLGPSPVLGASFTVDATHDAVDASPGDGVCADAGGACTLRAAVMETNALAGEDTIVLAQNVYALSILGMSEDGSMIGDLDVYGPVTIRGAGSARTLVDGNALDRVLDTIGPVSLEDLALQNGDSECRAALAYTTVASSH